MNPLFTLLTRGAMISLLWLAVAGCDDLCDDNERYIDGRCRAKPGACGEPMTDTCWEECSHLAPEICWTRCATGDEGCPCWDHSHCQGGCTLDCGQREADYPVGECSAQSGEYQLGCHCYVEGGIGQLVCAD
jgi:hypothetical protein